MGVIRILALFLSSATWCAAQSGDPAEMTQRARALLPGDRVQAEPLLREAVNLWEKGPAGNDGHAETLLLLGMTIYPMLAKDKEALAAEVEPMARKAAEIRQANLDTRAADLALALEFDALVLESLGRIDDSRGPKARARELRDRIITAMQPPSDEFTANPVHMGPGVRPPSLIVRAEPALTFEARLLRLNPEVLAELIIGTDGRLHQIEIYKPAGFGLDEKALEALMKWRLTPAQKDGTVVPVDWMIRTKFQ